jgi:hypothetical protein
MRGLIVGALAPTILSGCASMPNQDRNILTSAAVGAGAPRSLARPPAAPAGVWLGAAIGGAGGVIGFLIKENHWDIRNPRGEIWQVPFTDQRVKAPACF